MPMKVRYTVLDGEIVEENRGGVISDYVADPLGSTVALLDGSHSKSDTFNYWPYGEVQSRSGSTATPFQFVGTLGYYRDSSGRTYVRARYYRQNLGRWQTVDPLWPREPSYNYAHSRPTSSSDAGGKSPGLIVAAAVIADVTICGCCANKSYEIAEAKFRTAYQDWMQADFMVHCVGACLMHQICPFICHNLVVIPLASIGTELFGGDFSWRDVRNNILGHECGGAVLYSGLIAALLGWNCESCCALAWKIL